MGAVRFGTIVAAAALLCAAIASAQSTVLTLGTASSGGTYFVVGEAMARILTEKARLQVAPQQTQGPNQNMILVDDKKIALAMVTMGVALQGLTGAAPWTRGKKHENVRALFPMYDTPLQCAALKKSGITSFKQLDGKTVGTGPKAGTAGTYFPLIFEALGVKAQARNGQSADMANLLNDGVIDAFCFGAGVPIPAFSDLDAAQRVAFFTWTGPELATIRKSLPEFSETRIPKGAYKQQTNDQKTVGLFNFSIANKDMTDNLAYTITKTILENNAAMVRAHPATKETVAANAIRNAFLPFHPGAVRYYKEKGIKLDPGALPK
ncbi:MAG: TAXI family TRAP transporter solute-binding subunit [Rhodospirillales bacterium]|nr:TAXI family TRAP transporter solute-binding subunit [Rhodospirillales bacterium]